MASLLILVRLWRLVKLVGGKLIIALAIDHSKYVIVGVAVGVGETSEEDAKRLVKLEEMLRDRDRVLNENQQEMGRLRNLLHSRDRP